MPDDFTPPGETHQRRIWFQIPRGNLLLIFCDSSRQKVDVDLRLITRRRAKISDSWKRKEHLHSCFQSLHLDLDPGILLDPMKGETPAFDLWTWKASVFFTSWCGWGRMVPGFHPAVPERSSSTFGTPPQGFTSSSHHLHLLPPHRVNKASGAILEMVTTQKKLASIKREAHRDLRPTQTHLDPPRPPSLLASLTRLKSIKYPQRSLRDEASASAALHRTLLNTIIAR